MATQCFTGPGEITLLNTSGSFSVISSTDPTCTIGSFSGSKGKTVQIPGGEWCATYPDTWTADGICDEGCQVPAIPVLDFVSSATADPLDPTTLPGASCDNPSNVALCEIDDLLAAINAVTTAVESQVDTEFVTSGYICDPNTNTWVREFTAFIDGVAQPAQTIDSGISCDESQPVDYELVSVTRCNASGQEEVQFYRSEDDAAPVEIGTPILTGNLCGKQTVEVDTCTGVENVDVDQIVKVEGVQTVKICPEDVIKIDVEYVCNEDTNVYSQIITELTNGVQTNQTITDTTLSCDENLDFEQSRVCNDATNTVDIVTSSVDEDGVVTELSRVNTLEDCPEGQSDCVESQEWTYALDNTGTLFSNDNTIEISLSDGTSFTFNQPPAASWTPQMQIWGDEIQAAADAAGLAWFVETRYRYLSNPSNLSGLDGFSGPPSVAVALALTNMRYRYVNIQICPGQPTPVSARIIDSSSASHVGYSLTTDGPVKGPIQKFFVCRSCGDEPVWYLDDGVTLAEAGQIPDCWEPCGTLALTAQPPEGDCQFQTLIGCDNNNSTILADFTPNITRRAQVCNGEQIAVDYFQEDPNDPNALIEYALVGTFVDCATGEPEPLPDPICPDLQDVECEPYVIYPMPITDGGRDITQEENDILPSSDTIRNYTPWLADQLNVPPFPALGFSDTAPAQAVTGGFNDGATNIFRTRVFPAGLSSDDIPNCFGGGQPEEVTVNVDLRIEGLHSVAGVGLDLIIFLLDGPSTAPVTVDTITLVGSDLLGRNIYSLESTVPLTSLDDLRFAIALQTIEASTVELGWNVELIGVGATVEGCDIECVKIVHDPCASTQRRSANDLLFQIYQNTIPPVEVEEEIVPCSDFVVTDAYIMTNFLDGDLLSREWHDTKPALGTDATTADGRNFRETHDFSLPVDTATTINNFSLNDTDNTGQELDIQVIDGFITVDSDMMVRYSGTTEGYWAVELGECCGDLELLAESGGFFTTRTMEFELPAGTHRIRLWNIDSGGSNSSAVFGYSTDGGVTYTDDNTPPGIAIGSSKPTEECVKVKVCKDTGEMSNLFTEEVLTPSDLYPCPKLCSPKSNCLECG